MSLRSANDFGNSLVISFSLSILCARARARARVLSLSHARIHIRTETCRLYLQNISPSYEQLACNYVDFLQTCWKCEPDTIAAVALVYVSSITSGMCLS